MRHLTRRALLGQTLALAGTALTGSARAATLSYTRRWPDGRVPVVLGDHPFKKQIVTAIFEMNDKTNMQFVYVLAPPANNAPYVAFPNDGNGNYTVWLGAPQVGPNEVHINKNVRSVHELGHVAGLIHEHQRSDRDTYIQFLPAFNKDLFTDKDQKQNWEIEPGSINGNIPYNIHSFMHYWDKAGSDPDHEMRTMVYIPDPSLRFDTPEWLNDLAVQAINALYPTVSGAKEPFRETKDVSSLVLRNDLADVMLDAGPRHDRSFVDRTFYDRYNEGRTNPYLRWSPVSPQGDTFALYNAVTDGYLDAGANHMRLKPYRQAGEETSNPYLRWKFVRKYNYYLIYNSLTDGYLDAGPNHMRLKPYRGDDEDLSNPYLRWRWSDNPGVQWEPG